MKIEFRNGAGPAALVKESPTDADAYAMPMVAGHLAADTWAVIADHTGRFRERVTQDAFAKALKRDREQVKILFDHGKDSRYGGLPIATLEIAFVDVRGLVWGGRLFDNSIGRDLAPVLASGALGASLRFSVLDEQWEEGRDLERLPLRTIRDLEIYELGPVVFGAYPTSSAGISAPPRAAQRLAASRRTWPPVSRKQFIRSLAARTASRRR